MITKGPSKNHVTGREGGVSRPRKKLVSRATLKGFIREIHDHGRSRGGFLFQFIQVEIMAVGKLNWKKKERRDGAPGLKPSWSSIQYVNHIARMLWQPWTIMRKSLKADSHAWAPRIPKTSLTSGKNINKISVHYESTEVKQTVAARPRFGGQEGVCCRMMRIDEKENCGKKAKKRRSTFTSAQKYCKNVSKMDFVKISKNRIFF